jgi:hypothetical protein
MKEIQYLDILLFGILKKESGFKSYLVRKQKEAETKNFVSEAEFFENCNETVSLLENRIESQFLEKRYQLYQTIELLKSNKKPFEKELELANHLSKDHFNINLSTITNGKYKEELWYSQINLIKNCIVEIKNQNFIITSEIKDLDIDNYLDFIFSQKEISRETKKKAVVKLIEESKEEKTISNYRIWFDYVFNQHNYWKEITQDERKLFGELRAKSFEEMNALFINTIKGSPKPRAILKKEFEAVIIDRLSKEPFQKTTSDFMEGLLTKDLNILAAVIGKLDFIKSIQQPKGEKISEKWYALLYWFELKISGENPPMDVEGTFIKSEIAKIGALRCNSKGLGFYYAFKDIYNNNNLSLNKTFGIKWKELVKKISNNNPVIIKYIDENY